VCACARVCVVVMGLGRGGRRGRRTTVQVLADEDAVVSRALTLVQSRLRMLDLPTTTVDMTKEWIVTGGTHCLPPVSSYVSPRRTKLGLLRAKLDAKVLHVQTYEVLSSPLKTATSLMMLCPTLLLSYTISVSLVSVDAPTRLFVCSPNYMRPDGRFCRRPRPTSCASCAQHPLSPRSSPSRTCGSTARELPD
jgi:hypothetical protein